MKTLAQILMLFGLVAIFNGCSGGSSGGTTDTNKAPTAKQALVTHSFDEGVVLVYDLTTNVVDADGDDLNVTSLVMSDGSALPSGVSLVAKNIQVADTISVADGQNLVYDLNAIISDGEASVTYQVRVVIQDKANDSLMTYTLHIPDTDSNATLNGWVKLVDNDGLSNTDISFELLDRNDSNNSVYTAMMTDVGNDGNYTFSIDLQAQVIGASHYTFKTATISPVIGGENPQSDVVIRHNFQVISTPTISFANTSVDDNGGFVSSIVGTPTTDEVLSGAVYSIVSETPTTSGMLTIDSDTGEMTWDGDVGGLENYDITIKVTNLDGGEATTTFTLTVNNNG